MLNLTLGGLSGGYQKYLQRLAPLLAAHRDVQQLLQVVPPEYRTMRGLGSDAESWNAGEPWRGFPQLRRRVRDWKPDVVFIPTARYLNCNAPCVSMVRNMEPMLPQTLRDGVSAWGKRQVGAHLARRASAKSTRVIAVSGFVRDFMVSRWDIDVGKIGVVYHGVDEPSVSAACPSSLAAVGSAPFLFAAGSLLAYRGIEDAIEALAESVPSALQLVIAGTGAAAYQQRMHELAQRLGVSDRIFWVGHLAEADMSWAYTHCAAFLMTSRVEACPNTALEAMACGALSISTRSLPMPEFFQESALYYDAGNATQLADQIRHAMEMDAYHRQLFRERAYARSLQFTWQRTANATIEQLTRAAGHS